MSPDFSFNASLGLLHSKYDQLILGRDVASGSVGVDLAGNELPFAPSVTAQVGIDWKLAEVGDGKIEFLPRLSYTGHQWFSPFNDRESFPGDPIGNSRLKQGAMAKVDAQLLWSNDRVTAGFFVKNLFEKKYYLYGLDLRSFFGLDFLTPADPRTYGAMVRFNF